MEQVVFQAKTQAKNVAIEFPPSILMMDMDAEDIEETILREHDIIFGSGGGGGGSNRQQGRNILAIAPFVKGWTKSFLQGLLKSFPIYTLGRPVIC